MQEQVQLALEHHQAGRLTEAEELYRRVLQGEPNNADALHFLGLIAHQRGDYRSAVELIEKAHRCARPHSVSLNNLGRAYLALDRFREAKKCFSKALALKPDFAEAHNNLGAALRGLGQLQEAERSYQRALALKPDYANTHYNLGNLFMELGKLADAEQSYHRALALQPDYAEAHFNLGIVLEGLKRKQEAEQMYRRALGDRPDYFEACHNLGNVLKDLGRLDEAEQCYRKALALRPDSAETQLNLGNVLSYLGRLEEAEQSYRRAATLRPDQAEIHFGLGNILSKLDRQDEARRCYESAIALRPDFAAARWASMVATIPAVYAAEGEAAACRAAFLRELDGLVAWCRSHSIDDPNALGQHPFHLAYQEENNREPLSRYGELRGALMQRWLDAQPPPRPQSVANDAVRLGIVSAHVHDHSVWNALSRGWLRHLDRARVDVRVFYVGLKEDAETRAAKSMVSHFEQGLRDLREWVDIIRAHQVDVLLYPEIGMDMVTVQLASLRLAPVQLASWGHPETTGLPTIDYFLSAQGLEPPDCESNYTERLVRLPNLGCSYQPNRVADVEPNLGGLGIPVDVPLLLCPGTPFKYAPQHDRVLTAIAKELEECQFIFFTHHVPSLSDKLRTRLSKAFERESLDFKRHVVFVPWQRPPEFYGLMKRADALLDTIGFSGFNTAMQAVECALPIVTKEGRFMRGRFASGILKRMGLSELVATSDEEYVGLAVKLARDGGYRAQLRARLEASRETLFDDAAPTKALEDFLVSVAPR